MSIRVQNFAERCIFPELGLTTPLAVPAGKSTGAIPDQTTHKSEIAYRYIQNVGANPLYYAFGRDASPNYYHGILGADASGNGAGAQLDCSNHRLRVSVYSAAGTTVAVCGLKRDELGWNNYTDTGL